MMIPSEPAVTLAPTAVEKDGTGIRQAMGADRHHRVFVVGRTAQEVFVEHGSSRCLDSEVTAGR